MRADPEHDVGLLDLPVHAGSFSPDANWLIGFQTISQAVPGGRANIGHGLNEMGHRLLLNGMGERRHRRQLTMEMKERTPSGRSDGVK
ncbi:hypothetical protein D3C87_1845710 [compost metagenome]